MTWSSHGVLQQDGWSYSAAMHLQAIRSIYGAVKLNIEIFLLRQKVTSVTNMQPQRYKTIRRSPWSSALRILHMTR